MGDQTISAVVGRGSVCLSTIVNGVSKNFIVENVLHVPLFAYSLISLDLNDQQYLKESACLSNLQLWHERLCHVNSAGIHNMASKNIVEGLKVNTKSVSSSVCKGCVMGKLSRTPIPKLSTTSSDYLLDLVHTDVAEFPERSKGGAKYFITFIDDKSKMVTVLPIKSKSDCLILS
eukprot:IDg7423t1